jgi:hypothetical protein
MPSKVPFYSEQDLRNIPLPNHGGRYAVVSHGDVIDNAKNQLANAGFNITKEEYRSTLDGQVAQGVYHLDYAGDPDMGMMFAWSNSYNKTMRFKCAVGAYVFICGNGVVRGDMGSYSRKHSGTALPDVISEIDHQISHAKEHYDILLGDKQMLKNVTLTPQLKGKILGELFAYDEILTLTQVGIVKREMDRPSHTYNSDVHSAWTMYNHITLALKESHPSTFMKDHQRVHGYFVDAFGQLVAASPVHDAVQDEDEDDETYDVLAPDPVSPAGGSDFDIDKADAMSQSLYGVNFL